MATFFGGIQEGQKNIVSRRRSRKYTRILLEILDQLEAGHAIRDYVTLSALSLAFAHRDSFVT